MILKNYLKGGVMILKKGGSMILKKSWLWWGHVSEKSQLGFVAHFVDMQIKIKYSLPDLLSGLSPKLKGLFRNFLLIGYKEAV